TRRKYSNAECSKSIIIGNQQTKSIIIITQIITQHTNQNSSDSLTYNDTLGETLLTNYDISTTTKITITRPPKTARTSTHIITSKTFGNPMTSTAHHPTMLFTIPEFNKMPTEH
ncbi:5213_t:CDS:2, partial [Racocetra fulgida]